MLVHYSKRVKFCWSPLLACERPKRDARISAWPNKAPWRKIVNEWSRQRSSRSFDTPEQCLNAASDVSSSVAELASCQPFYPDSLLQCMQRSRLLSKASGSPTGQKPVCLLHEMAAMSSRKGQNCCNWWHGLVEEATMSRWDKRTTTGLRPFSIAKLLAI